MTIAKPGINIDKPEKYSIPTFSYSWDCGITLLLVTHFHNCLL